MNRKSMEAKTQMSKTHENMSKYKIIQKHANQNNFIITKVVDI